MRPVNRFFCHPTMYALVKVEHNPEWNYQHYEVPIIVRACCQVMRTQPWQLNGATRKRHVIMARFMAYKLIKQHHKYTLKQLAAVFGMPDHSTVINGLKTINNLLQTDKETYAKYIRVVEKLRKGDV